MRLPSFSCIGFIFEKGNLEGTGSRILVVDGNSQGCTLEILAAVFLVEFLCVIAR